MASTMKTEILALLSLKAGTTVSIAPVEDDGELESSQEPLELKQDGLFRITRDDESFEWVDIVVPCYGYCVIRRASVDHFVPAASQESSVSLGYSGSITPLVVRDSDQEMLLPLIEFIDPKLQPFSTWWLQNRVPGHP
ncbi:hypothetical protein Gpo141_00014807 [Globisporangium polare]